MNTSEFIKGLESFCSGSQQFAGFVMCGMYSISFVDFATAFEHYLETGENFLDEHAEILHASWEGRYDDFVSIFDKETIEKLESYIKKDNFWNIDYLLDSDSIYHIKEKIRLSKEHWAKLDTYEYRRLEACKYTSNQTIRRKVFKRDGKICKWCKSIKQLTLDHIIPVAEGGKDDLSNLQVLCKSCNSKKGKRLVA